MNNSNYRFDKIILIDWEADPSPDFFGIYDNTKYNIQFDAMARYSKNEISIYPIDV